MCLDNFSNHTAADDYWTVRSRWAGPTATRHGFLGADCKKNGAGIGGNRLENCLEQSLLESSQAARRINFSTDLQQCSQIGDGAFGDRRLVGSLFEIQI